MELVWSKVQVVLRKIRDRFYGELQVALQKAVNAIALCDIGNWFAHDGYKPCQFKSLYRFIDS